MRALGLRRFLTLHPFEIQVGGEAMQIESFGLSDVGRKREKNEDNFLVEPQLQLYMVADGMGGHVGGEFASQMAVETVQTVITELTQDPEATLQESAEIKPGDYKSYLRFAISQASAKIFERACQDSKLQGMGTTSVVLIFRNNKAFVANVGDSRAYRIRKGKIEQLTLDHSLVGEQIRAGMIQTKDAKDHRLKNIITRSVGFQEEVEADVEAKAVKEGDIFLLCTDGLYNLVEDEEMLEVTGHHDLKSACRHLIDIANARGGDDNVTVILNKVVSLESEEDEESTIKL